MFNDLNKMKSFSLDIPVLKETIAKLEISIQNIENIGTDVENIGDKLIFESWEGNATNKFKEHQQDWKRGYDDMLNQLIDFKESLEKVVLAGAEEINELALELPTPLGGSKADDIIEGGSFTIDYVKRSEELGKWLEAEGYKVIDIETAGQANADWTKRGYTSPPVAEGTKVYNVEAGNHEYARV